MPNKNIIIKNIYYMLAYAFQALNQSAFEDIAAEEFDNIQNLFAAILATGIGQQIKQGLYREYLDHTEDLTTMRGKVEMNGTIRNEINHRRSVSCEYDELTENCLHNRILKTTANLLIRSDEVKAEYKDRLAGEMRYFSSVDEIRDISSISWSSIRFHRNNQTYQILISLCQLIIEGMLLTTDSGIYKLASFVDEQRMCRLYEKFILEYYRREHPEITAEASQIDWAQDECTGTRLPVMQSDIMLSSRKGSNVLIIDAKYYSHETISQYGTPTLHSNNLYQIFTYVKNKDAEYTGKPHKVSGMLLYARTTDPFQPDGSYKMSGNYIYVKTLDLNREFSEISGQLDEYVQTYM